jgi:biopolymer transport protein ExbB
MRRALIAVLAMWSAESAGAQEPGAEVVDRFAGAAATAQKKLAQSLAELSALHEQIAAESSPLRAELASVEAELIEVRAAHQDRLRARDRGALEVQNLRGDIEKREAAASYVRGLLNDYRNEFESRVHIAELGRYRDAIDTAKAAADDADLPVAAAFEAQLALLNRSIDRLEGVLGGTSFDGTAIDSRGFVTDGRFVLLGPVAVFRSSDGHGVGAVTQPLGSLEPTVLEFPDPGDATAAAEVVSTGVGELPIDPTLGGAFKLRSADAGLLAEFEAGGPVMWPILVLAAATLLVALWKWFGLVLLRRPSPRQIQALMTAVSRRDRDEAERKAREMKGPLGRMLRVGVEHLDEPRELIEEVMYETVMTTRLGLQRFLPFVAISAAAAPLLGLLGTVTGIITTFKLITAFGSGDVGLLSAGISEALITTKWGLIVAIPSLLLHALLSRKARGVVGHMESVAVAFVNQVGRTPLRRTESLASAGQSGRSDTAPMPDPDVVREQVNEILESMLQPLLREHRT